MGRVSVGTRAMQPQPTYKHVQYTRPDSRGTTAPHITGSYLVIVVLLMAFVAPTFTAGVIVGAVTAGALRRVAVSPSPDRTRDVATENSESRGSERTVRHLGD